MGGGASKSAQLYYADTLASSNAEIAKITAKLRYADTLASSNAEIAKIVQESASQTDRIPFYGTEPENFREGEQVIVSFPGVHGYGWKKLTQVSSSKHTPFASSCIFLPDEKTPGYGLHDIQRGKHCSCHFLYNGEIAKWGCHWFSQWKEQTLRAHGRRCKLVVVTKKDGSLGRCKQEKCSSWRPKRFLTSQLPLSSLPEEFLIEETGGGGGAGSFGVAAESFGVTRKKTGWIWSGSLTVYPVTDSFGVTRKKTGWISSSIAQYTRRQTRQRTGRTRSSIVQYNFRFPNGWGYL